MKKTFAIVFMLITVTFVFSIPVAGSDQNAAASAYSRDALWIQEIDIAKWAQDLGEATYSNMDEWTQNPDVAKWARKTDILSYADDIVFAYEYQQTQEQIKVSGENYAIVIVHADGTDEIIHTFAYEFDEATQTMFF